jgi:isocitrate lyase
VVPSHEAPAPLTETFTSSTGSKIRGGTKCEKSDTRRRMSPKSGPKRLRELLKQPGIIRSLGAHDVFTALIVEQDGFETVFIGGFGTSASMLGLPDLNFLTMSEMADAVRRMAVRVCIPVIADGDTGYGDLHNVQRTVEAFEAAGASGILLEDQVMPKRCGHFANKRVIPSEEMVLKIKVAVKAKSDPDIVVFARAGHQAKRGACSPRAKGSEGTRRRSGPSLTLSPRGARLIGGNAVRRRTPKTFAAANAAKSAEPAKICKPTFWA